MKSYGQPIVIAVNNRHIHLSEEDSYQLFGEGYQLNMKRPLSLKAYAAKETVDLEYEGQRISGVRVVGPYRSKTQIELLESDCMRLYNKPAPKRMSGDLEDTLGIDIIGPEGRITINDGVIIAQNHAHLNDVDLEYFGVSEGDTMSVGINGNRLEDIIVKSGSQQRTAVHIDVDVAHSVNLYEKTAVGMLYFDR